ncbi:hypothetical protein FOMPIDRAFT_1130316 [Fomitopsis schrenkii]|uniref:Uncharacterized protein n=1 Tax=Fomitopsis schrenkii TaxID=2126942 RepID=S8FDA8_FOMSC|nr:hypothetical protein FOMPIDRAFT_1130316 [Fomitopsis schrenkii]
MSAESMTSHRHNDYVGGDASKGRIPGAEKATSGHQFNAIFPKSDAAPKRAQEHLPQPTGRDAPPSGSDRPLGKHINTVTPGDQLQNGQVDEVTHTHPSAQCIQSARTTGQPIELAPAPDSHTVIDRDPYAPRTSAADTLTGATSQDVHNHLGHPGTGQTSSELHHDGQHGRKRAARGADQFGSGAIPREIEQPGEL